MWHLDECLPASLAHVGAQGSSNDTSPGVFGQFASHWFPAMVSAVIGSAEEAAQQGIHYLLLDVCLTCLTWPSLFPTLHKGGAPGLPAGVQLAAEALMDYLVSLLTPCRLPVALVHQQHSWRWSAPAATTRVYVATPEVQAKFA